MGRIIDRYRKGIATPGGWIDYVAVLVVGGRGNDVTAYAGIGTEEWVAQYGRKLTVDEACKHFQGLRKQLDAGELTYRE